MSFMSCIVGFSSVFEGFDGEFIGFCVEISNWYSNLVGVVI